MPWVGSAASTHPDGDPHPQVCADGDGYDSGVTTRQNAAMSEALAMVAPGQPLRDGLDRILRAKRGGLVVVGDGPDVLSICSGGFLLCLLYTSDAADDLLC